MHYSAVPIGAVEEKILNFMLILKLKIAYFGVYGTGIQGILVAPIGGTRENFLNNLNIFFDFLIQNSMSYKY